MKKIKDILEAPLVDCKVKNKDTGDVLYHGDSSYEANKAYTAALKNNVKPVYDKRVTRLVPENEKAKRVASGKEVLLQYRDLIQKVPERIQNIYSSVLSGRAVDDATLELAELHHPEYFNQT